jgi:hypothetical protein
MNRIISLFLFIFIASCLNAQYNSPIRNKVTLGKQTTADGLVWRGLTSDTANLMTNKLDTSVYLVLDTMTEAMWLYRVTTTPKWNRVVDSLNNMQGILSVAKGGTGASVRTFVDTINTQTVNGAKTLTSNLILKNSQEPLRSTFLSEQTFGADTTNWTRGTGWTFNGTQAVATAATGSLTYTTLPNTITPGRAYEVTYTQTGYTSGTATIALGNVTLAIPQYNVGINIILLSPSSATGGFRITTSTYTGNLDDISIVEITGSAPIILAGQDDSAATLYNSLRMPNSTTIAFGGGAARTTGIRNNFFGLNSGQKNTTGSNNNFFGLNAGLENTSGINNNFFGSNAGQQNTIGSNNNFFGANAGNGNTTGLNNNIFGKNAGIVLTTGNNNNFFGTSAGFKNTTGSDNVFIGESAGYENTTGIRNNFIGINAGRNNTTGQSNFFFGQSAGRSNTTGNSNVGIGDFTFNQLGDITTGESNIFIGGNAGDNITGNASGNFVLGNLNDLPIASGSNQVVIKNIIFATGANGTGTNIAGSVGIGTNSPQARLHVKGSTNALEFALKVDDTGGTNLLSVQNNGAATFRDFKIDNPSNAQITINTNGELGFAGAYFVFNRKNNTRWAFGLSPYNGNNDFEINPKNTFVALTIKDSTGEFIFKTIPENSGNGTERMRITSTGNVGIGANGSAGYKLDVNGTGRFSGALTGTSATFSSSVTANSLTLTTPLTVANGGTNTSTAFTTGSVVFAGASGTYTQANEDIRFITGDKRLVLGPNTVLSTLPFSGVRFKSMGKIQIARSDEDTRFISLDNEDGIAKMDFKAPGAGHGAFQFTQTNNADTRNLMLFNGSGNVGIKTPTFNEITQALHVVGNARITAVGTVSDGNAALYVTSTGVLSTNASDVNKKHNIRNLPYGLSTINNLNPVAFEWNETDETDIGFIAQDIENVIPESVITNWDSELIFRQEKIIPVLVKAIQEQTIIIKQLKDRILTLENK